MLADQTVKTCVDLRANLSSNQSQCKTTQVTQAGGQTKRKLKTALRRLASPLTSPLTSPVLWSVLLASPVLWPVAASPGLHFAYGKDLRVTGYKDYSISSKTCGRVFIETSKNFFRIYQRVIIWWLYQELCLVSWYRGTVKRRSNTTSHRTRPSTQVPAWINTLLGLLGSFRFFRWMVSFPLFTRLWFSCFTLAGETFKPVCFLFIRLFEIVPFLGEVSV